MKTVLLTALFVLNNLESSHIMLPVKHLDAYSYNDLNALVNVQSTNITLVDPDYALDFTGNVLDPEFELPENSSVFERTPIYDLCDINYENIEMGDFVYERNQIMGIGHIGMVIDPHFMTEYGEVVLTLEAVGTKVQYCFLDDVRFVDKNVQMIAPCIDYETRYYAALFMISQLGKPYSIDLFRTNTSDLSESWYCSELIYAAYLSCEFDLSLGSSWNGQTMILPNQIYESLHTYEFNVIPPYLYMSINAKNFNVWNIKISNYHSQTVMANYNSYMCFNSDAQTRSSNLNHILSTPIATHSNSYVNITENYFADSIVCSFTYSTIRLITVCTNLNASNNSLSSSYYIQRNITDL